MRNPSHYKIIHLTLEAHRDLAWIKSRTRRPMTQIIESLAAAAREGMSENGCIDSVV